MAASVQKTRNLYESYLHRDKEGIPGVSAPGRARQTFVAHMRHRLGLCDKNGDDYKDRAGNRVLRECPDPQHRLRAEDFSFKELMESIVGPGTSNFLADDRTLMEWKASNFAVTERFANDPRALLEAPGVGVSPSAFADINAWTAINSGLIERRILEAFENPMFIGDMICPDEQTRIAEGQKVIGASRIGPKALIRNPGEPHPRAGLGERWVQLPRTQEWALAIDITREAAFFDLTGQVLQHAGNVGEWIAYQKELRKIGAVIGTSDQTGNSTSPNAFNYDGTAFQLYNTTAPSSLANMINAQTGNPMIGGDWTTFQSSWLLAQRMVDPETQTRILTMPDTVLVNPAALATADLIIGARGVERRTAPGATQSSAVTLTIQDTAMNPTNRLGVKNVLSSPLLEMLCLNATTANPIGLGLSQSDTNNRWWHFASGKAFKNMVTWPLSVMQAPAASNYEMIDRGLIQSTFANERSTPSVWNIWGAIQNAT